MKNKLANINSNNGRFIDGNPNTGTLGTIVTAEWLNGVQDRMQDVYEELRNVLLLGNLQPDGQRQNQVAEAIKAYCNNINLKVQSNTRNFDNYIPNSKKSNAVNSNSADTVATSYAVKAAYDLADAAYKVDTNNQNQNLNNLLGQNTVFGTSGRAAGTTGLSGIYSYGVGLAMSAAGARAMLYIPHSHAGSNNGVWVQASFAGNNSAAQWRRIDGADFADIRGNPFTVAGYKISSTTGYISVQASNAGYAGLEVERSGTSGNWQSRFEALPDRRWKFWTNSDSRGFEQYLPAKSGTIALMDDVNGRVSKSGDTMTGTLSVKNGEYSALHTYNTANWLVKWESAPQSAAHFAAIVQANNNGAVVNRVLMPKKSGIVLLDSDGSILGDANTYVKRDVAGDIFARLLRSTYQNESRMVGAIAFRVNNGTDNFTRYCDSPAAVRNWLGVNVQNIVVLQGVINHGGTLPLPSGFNESQCKFIISTNNSNPNGATWDWNESFKGKHYRNICELNGRVVTCQTVVNDGISGNGAIHTIINGKANYMVIGVK
ncbi:Phage tail fibre repeat [Mannheimia haemolytica]|uniref:Phage tail fibre repeat n=1 Tax=Mannheimia haemolytica TaxID=75985 RepID=A0A448T4I4_MANHA|nr:tail fiber protein [Mannheimia haemolytica]VEI74841.1 Phage tail fibre repeat [Mannheimia haemolytica]